MKTMARSFSVLFLSMIFLVPVLTGCEQQGPAEKAGEAIDEAAEDAGNAVKDATN